MGPCDRQFRKFASDQSVAAQRYLTSKCVDFSKTQKVQSMCNFKCIIMPRVPYAEVVSKTAVSITNTNQRHARTDFVKPPPAMAGSRRASVAPQLEAPLLRLLSATCTYNTNSSTCQSLNLMC